MPPPSSAAKGSFLAKKLATQDQVVLAFSCARKYSSKRELLEVLGDTGASKSKKKKLKLPKPMPVPIPTAKTHLGPGSPLTVSPSLSILLKSDDAKASSRSSSSESACHLSYRPVCVMEPDVEDIVESESDDASVNIRW